MLILCKSIFLPLHQANQNQNDRSLIYIDGYIFSLSLPGIIFYVVVFFLLSLSLASYLSFSYANVKDNTRCALTRTACLRDNSTNRIVGVIHCGLMPCRLIYVIGPRKMRLMISRRICSSQARREEEEEERRCGCTIVHQQSSVLFLSFSSTSIFKSIRIVPMRDDELLSSDSIIFFVVYVLMSSEDSYPSDIALVIDSC